MGLSATIAGAVGDWAKAPDADNAAALHAKQLMPTVAKELNMGDALDGTGRPLSAYTAAAAHLRTELAHMLENIASTAAGGGYLGARANYEAASKGTSGTSGALALLPACGTQ